MRGNTKHKAYNLDVFDFLKRNDEKVDFIYFDPPYNSRQYGAVLHVMETIALFDAPKVAGVNNKRSLWKRSDFSLKNKAKVSFENLFELSSQITDEIYISYSSDGLLSFCELTEIIKKYFPNTETYYSSYRRFKTRSDVKKTILKEIIVNANK